MKPSYTNKGLRTLRYGCSACSSTRLPARCISTTGAQSANPHPAPATPGPPPKAPESAPSFTDDRVARKKRQAELVKIGQNLRANPSKPSSPLAKKFWKEADIQETNDGIQILLDARPLRTTSKQNLVLPARKRDLAIAIAAEWDALTSAQQALKQHYIPLTALASRATDIATADREGNSALRDSVVKMLMAYLQTDTLLCWAPAKNRHDGVAGLDPAHLTPAQLQQLPPEQRDGRGNLRALQEQTARPIIDYLTANVWPGVQINPVLESDSILPTPQPEGTTAVVRGWVEGLPAFELAGLERAVLATKSLLVSARLLVEWSPELQLPSPRGGWDMGALGEGEEISRAEGVERFGIEEARQACNVEVIWQTNMWGEVEDTHDVDKEDVRRQLGSVLFLISNSGS